MNYIPNIKYGISIKLSNGNMSASLSFCPILFSLEQYTLNITILFILFFSLSLTKKQTHTRISINTYKEFPHTILLLITHSK